MNQVSLSYGGMQVQDQDTLAAHDILDGSTIYIKLKEIALPVADPPPCNSPQQRYPHIVPDSPNSLPLGLDSESLPIEVLLDALTQDTQQCNATAT